MPHQYSQEGFDVEVVRGEDDLEEHLLINGDELLVPLANVGGPLASIVGVCRVRRGQRLAPVVFAVLKDLYRCHLISIAGVALTSSNKSAPSSIRSTTRSEEEWAGHSRQHLLAKLMRHAKVIRVALIPHPQACS